MRANRILLRFTIRQSDNGPVADFVVDSELTEADKPKLVETFSAGLERLVAEFAADPKLVSIESNGHVPAVKEMVLPPTQNWPGDPEDDAA